MTKHTSNTEYVINESDEHPAPDDAHGQPAAAPWDADREAGAHDKGGKIPPLVDKKDPE